MSDKGLDRVRAIIAAFPETSEKLSHGSPTWWGGKKTFACFHNGSYDDGRPAVWIKAPDGAQQDLIASDPDRFYRPKYLGPSGWVAMRLHGRPRWKEAEFLLEQGYRMVAPKRAIAQLDTGERVAKAAGPRKKGTSNKSPHKDKIRRDGRAGSSKAQAHVALLRGINVGGKNKLPMASLVRAYESAGATEVRTYIQSGNVVFACSPSKLSRIAQEVERALREELGLEVPVVYRSAKQLKVAAAKNPFLDEGVDPKELHLGFLLDKPKPSSVRELDPDRSPGDRFAVIGAQIYLHFPKGVARTKLTSAYLDRSLGTVCTIRNWRTVGKLLEICTSA